MTLFDNLKNKLFKEETSGKGKESQPAGKSKDLQDRIKGLFAKKPDEVEQAVDFPYSQTFICNAGARPRHTHRECFAHART